MRWAAVVVVLVVQTDVASPEQCNRLVAKAIERFGRVDVLVNNAGVGTAAPATHETPEQFRDRMRSLQVFRGGRTRPASSTPRP